MKNISCVYDLVIIIYAINVALFTGPFDGGHVRAKKNGITETVKQGFYLFVFFFQFKEEIKVVFSFHIFLFHIYFFPGWKPFQQLQR